MTVDMMEEPKHRNVQIKKDNVQEIDLLTEKLKKETRVDMTFADTVNMLLREALEIRKARQNNGTQ